MRKPQITKNAQSLSFDPSDFIRPRRISRCGCFGLPDPCTSRSTGCFNLPSPLHLERRTIFISPQPAHLASPSALTPYRERNLGHSDNAGFRVNLPDRESFSPDAAYYIGPNPGMKFFEGAPIFAVEVRSENDYGPDAERDIAKKRADYFASGTKVEWDVDLLSDDVVKVYRYTDPNNPTIYRRGEIAEAEPAVPGWRMPVDDLFDEGE